MKTEKRFPLVIIRQPKPDKDNFFIKPYLDNDSVMNRRELNVILHKAAGITIEELAMMHEEFRLKPNTREAHFGIEGRFMYVK